LLTEISKNPEPVSLTRKVNLSPRYKMTVVLVSEFFAPGMGYLENLFPKYLARAGVETHVVATDLPLSYRDKGQKTYQNFVQPLPAGTVTVMDGYTVHILGHERLLGHMRIAGLGEALASLHPDVVQTMTPIGWIANQCAWYKLRLGYKLFSGCHHHSSVFPLASQSDKASASQKLHCMVTRTIPGRLASFASEKCHCISSDCADVATRFFGVPQKQIIISTLGVDTELFFPATQSEELANRVSTRSELGFADRDIVCVYSGRFTSDKNPALLARAVAALRSKGEPYRGLFVGGGPQADEIQKCNGCVIHEFIPVRDLGALYRAADIGVWPTQESLSMLDAAACGLPIVVNHTMNAPERIEGNGLTYALNDLNDLIRVLRSLRSNDERRKLGSVGASKMASNFSWESVTRSRIADYEVALPGGVPFQEAAQHGSDR
jgi:glycosyltransferase involved in cell wall biosynthesis